MSESGVKEPHADHHRPSCQGMWLRPVCYEINNRTTYKIIKQLQCRCKIFYTVEEITINISAYNLCWQGCGPYVSAFVS